MVRTHWQRTICTILFFITFFLYIAFFVYIGSSESVSVYRSEDVRGYYTITDVQTRQLLDDEAPIGIRKVYQWVLEDERVKSSTLLFNISHHDITVFFDNELVYNLTAAESNRIGTNVCSNWCFVYVGPERVGQTVTVVLTPLLEAAMDKEPTFLFGSHWSVIQTVVCSELPILVLSSLCILLGIFVFMVSLYFQMIKDQETNGLGYLGLFSAMLGLWKLTDLSSITLLFPHHTMALGYTSVGALYLGPICLLNYFSSMFVKDCQRSIRILANCCSLICIVILAMQLLGIEELRQNLIIGHVLLVISLVSVPLTAIFNKIAHKTWGLHGDNKLLLLLAIGIALDLLLYYLNNDNGLISFSIIGFIVYTLIISLQNIREADRKAYIDSRTGLVNRNRWNELMNEQKTKSDSCGIIVVDLNGLKQVNDTLGHEAGDQMILQLSELLRNTMPRSSAICRWGGDEFAVLLKDTSREQLQVYIQMLLVAGEQYNLSHSTLPIHFAIGAALSVEHPNASRSDLFRLADEDMYHNKQLWYANLHSTS